MSRYFMCVLKKGAEEQRWFLEERLAVVGATVTLGGPDAGEWKIVDVRKPNYTGTDTVLSAVPWRVTP